MSIYLYQQGRDRERQSNGKGGPKEGGEKQGDNMKWKEEGEGLSEQKKKRSRKGGNDAIEFLREKENIDMTMKQE